MTYIQCTPTQPQLIAVNKLEKSPLNARRTAAQIGMNELKASLLAHGLMQNLVVTDEGDGMYRAIAGGRRLEAIHSLQAEGKLPQDFAVPCQIVTEAHALEMSLAEKPSARDGTDVQFKRPRLNPPSCKKATIAGDGFEAVAKSLPLDWLKPTDGAARFESFRSLPETAKLELLAYCIALTLKPKLAPDTGDAATAYDTALTLTAADVAAYWRPTKDNLLGRLNRQQLLVIGRDVFGDAWPQSHFGDKKASLVDQLDRAFSNPDGSGRTPDQIAKLKSWLPEGMPFAIAASPKPAKTGKARKAA